MNNQAVVRWMLACVLVLLLPQIQAQAQDCIYDLDRARYLSEEYQKALHEQNYARIRELKAQRESLLPQNCRSSTTSSSNPDSITPDTNDNTTSNGTAGNTGIGPGITTAGDPVNIGNGNFIRTERDFSLPALGQPLALYRTYNSQNSNIGPFGIGWTFAWGDQLIITPDAVTWQDSSGASYRFNRTTAGLVAPDQLSLTLTPSTIGYTLTALDGDYQTFDSQGRLTGRFNRHGHGQTLRYDEHGDLSSVTDPSGRTLRFQHNADGQIIAVSDFTDRTWRYRYDGIRLLAVTSPNDATTVATVTRYAYYDQAPHRDLLARIIEPNGGQREIRYYPDGLVAQVTDPMGNKEIFAYTPERRETRWTDPNGNTTLYRYNDFGSRIETVYPDGSREQHRWARGLVTAHTDPLGQQETFVYDDQRNLLQATDRTGIQTAFAYDDQHRLLRYTRPGGRIFEYRYDTQGNLTAVIDPLGYALRFDYDAHGLPHTITDANGATTRYAYNAFGQIVQQENALGAISHLTYDARGNLTERTDPAGQRTRFHYDLLNRPLAITDAAGQTVQFTYDAAGQLITITDTRGTTQQFAYDLNGRLIQQRYADGSTVQLNYDPLGQLLALTDENGAVTRFAYNARGHLVREQRPDGSVIRADYDQRGNLITLTDPNGHTTRFEYDAAERLLAVTDALGARQTYRYNAVGLLEQRSDRRGSTLTYRYDLLNRPSQINGPEGLTLTYTYDPVGNLLNSTQYNLAGLAVIPDDPRQLPASRQRRYSATYDALGQLLSQSDPAGHTTHFNYDSNGNLIRTTSPTGRTLDLSYDALNRLIAYTHSDGTRSQLRYDGNGNTTAIITPSGAVWEFAYDPRNRLIALHDPLQRTTRYDYDPAGNLIKRHHPDATWVTYTYDAMARPLAIQRSDGSYSNYHYDPAGNLLTALTAATRLDFQYDALGRSISEHLSFSNYDFTALTRLAYDPVGNLTEVISPSGIRTRYTYDNANRLKQLVASPNIMSAHYAYNGFGAREALKLDNGISGTYGYDAAGWLQLIHYSRTDLLAAFRYTRDDDGNPVGIDEQIRSQSTRLDLRYDALGRIAQVAANDPSRQEIFSYDADGNIQRSVHGIIEYDSASQPLTSQWADFSHDERGNLRELRKRNGQSLTFTYDAENHLIGLQGASERSFLYDALGRRVATITGKSAEFITYTLYNISAVFKGQQSVFAVISGTDINNYLAIRKNSQTEYLLSDLVASIRVTTDQQGRELGRWDFGVFGQEQSSTTEPVFGFGSNFHVNQTDFYDLKARWYLPNIGRFNRKDDLLFSGIQPNPYIYSFNQPFLYSDPMGLWPTPSGNTKTLDSECGSIKPGLSTGKTHLFFTAQDGLIAADLAYDAVEGAISSNGRWVVDETITGISGLRALVIKSTRPNDPRVVLAFAGTFPPGEIASFNDFIDFAGDAYNDVAQAAGLIPPQYISGLLIAGQLKEKYGNNLIIAGHSLGGGIGGYVSSVLNTPGYFYNSAPLSFGTSLHIALSGNAVSQNNINQFRNYDDPVSGYVGQFLTFASGGFSFHPGKQHILNGGSNGFRNIFNFESHGLGSINLCANS